MAGRVFVNSTRLVPHLRALPSFLRDTESVVRQLRGVDGFLRGSLLVEPRLAFWTLTMWDGPRAMRAFRDAGAHAAVMPLLGDHAQEASYVGWWQDEETLPSWTEVHRHFRSDATFTPLPRGKLRHRQGLVPAPRFGLPRPVSPDAVRRGSGVSAS